MSINLSNAVASLVAACTGEPMPKRRRTTLPQNTAPAFGPSVPLAQSAAMATAAAIGPAPAPTLEADGARLVAEYLDIDAASGATGYVAQFTEIHGEAKRITSNGGRILFGLAAIAHPMLEQITQRLRGVFPKASASSLRQCAWQETIAYLNKRLGGLSSATASVVRASSAFVSFRAKAESLGISLGSIDFAHPTTAIALVALHGASEQTVRDAIADAATMSNKELRVKYSAYYAKRKSAKTPTSAAKTVSFTTKGEPTADDVMKLYERLAPAAKDAVWKMISKARGHSADAKA